jgi:hypothetical protein
MRVPKDLASALRKRELKRSLNTKDFREARRRYQSAYGELLRHITEARARLNVGGASGQSVSEDAMKEAVRLWFFRTWEQCQSAFDAPPSRRCSRGVVKCIS